VQIRQEKIQKAQNRQEESHLVQIRQEKIQKARN
jgi:hypothetical protein